ncbi:hypothetical protein, partial [Mycobacterium intracellulare]|uniref:hypothetical protein n=1 Tax=Mycobacterium intracellulare TaxID=1767 RepID=UPI00358DB6CB
AAVALGAPVRGGHRPEDRRAVRQDRRASGHPRGGQARISHGLARAARTAGDVVAGGAHRAVDHLRDHRHGAGSLPGHRRRERLVLCGG